MGSLSQGKAPDGVRTAGGGYIQAAFTGGGQGRKGAQPAGTESACIRKRRRYHYRRGWENCG